MATAGLIQLQPEELEPEVAGDRQEQVVRLGDFLAEHRKHGLTASGRKAAPQTVEKWRAPMDRLIRFFGYDRDITTITQDDAYQFRVWLDEHRICRTKANPGGRALSSNTIHKQVDNAKVFFTAAENRGLIKSSPFAKIVSSTTPNHERDFFVTRDMTERIIAECPDAEWRLLVALWRYAGLRKMEVFRLTWGDVLWQKRKFRVHCTKTQHHKNKGIRYAPLRDVLVYLEDVFHAALKPGQTTLPADAPIITRFSATNSNLDKPFKAILHRAGIVPWSKLFWNLRSSCETEWLNWGLPAHKVAAWIGHSIKVQQDHYAQVRDEDFVQFDKADFPTEAVGSKSGPKTGPTDNATHAKDHADAVVRLAENTGFQRKRPEKPRLSGSSNSGGGIRTPDTRIMIPLL